VPLNEVMVLVGTGFGRQVRTGQAALGPGCKGRMIRPPGQRCNPNKLLSDPYATGEDGNSNGTRPPVQLQLQRPRQPQRRRSAPRRPKALVITPSSTGAGNDPPRRVMSMPYTCLRGHVVKGLTQHNPTFPRGHWGKYAGIAHSGHHRHLKSLASCGVEMI